MNQSSFEFIDNAPCIDPQDLKNINNKIKAMSTETFASWVKDGAYVGYNINGSDSQVIYQDLEEENKPFNAVCKYFRLPVVPVPDTGYITSVLPIKSTCVKGISEMNKLNGYESNGYESKNRFFSDNFL